MADTVPPPVISTIRLFFSISITRLTSETGSLTRSTTSASLNSPKEKMCFMTRSAINVTDRPVSSKDAGATGWRLRNRLISASLIRPSATRFWPIRPPCSRCRFSAFSRSCSVMRPSFCNLSPIDAMFIPFRCRKRGLTILHSRFHVNLEFNSFFQLTVIPCGCYEKKKGKDKA